MVVDGNGCSGYQVSYEIYDENIIPSMTRRVGRVMGTFDSAGYKADTIWIASGTDIDDPSYGLTSKPPADFRFRFIAAASNPVSTVASNDLTVPTNSETGCLNCDTLFAQDPCRCADGRLGAQTRTLRLLPDAAVSQYGSGCQRGTG